MLKNIICFLALFLALSTQAYSQVILKGEVRDKEEGIPYANVILKDSLELVAGTVTDLEGKFELSTQPGNYTLEISYLGYEPYVRKIELNSDTEIGMIALTMGDQVLDEVTVVSMRDMVEQKIDRLVFNVEGNVAAKGGNAINAIELAPGVMVSDQTISILGKSGSVRILIDGKLVQIPQDEVSGFLASIPSEDIKEIEIITNPPAKYEAQGNGGLINIVYKKGRRNSWNNRIFGSASQAEYGWYNVGNNFTYNKDKLGVVLNLNKSFGDFGIDRTYEIEYSDGPWISKRNDVWDNDALSGRAMIDYQFSDNVKVGVQYMGNITNPDVDMNNIDKKLDNAGNLEFVLGSTSLTDLRNESHMVNTHFETKLDTLGRNLSIDLDYFTYGTDHSRNVQTRDLGLSGEESELVFSNLTLSDEQLDNYNIRVDMDHPIGSVSLAYGVNVNFSENNYEIYNFNTLSGEPEVVENQTDNFNYTEDKQAAYISASTNFGEKVSVKAGLRGENTETKGVSRVLNQTTEIDYFRLFPTLYISYNKDDKNSFAFNYGRRIRRPFYFQLSPARLYFTAFSYTEGNPVLQPSFTDNFEFTHTFSGNLVTTLSYSSESDGFDEISFVNEETQEQAYSYRNFYTHNTYSLSSFYNFNTFNWFQNRSGFYLIYSHSEFSEAGESVTPQNGMRYYFSTNNTFILNSSRTIKGQMNFWYSSPYNNNMYEFGESYKLDLAIQFSLLKEKNLDITAGVYDVFDSSPSSSTVVINGITQTGLTKPSNRFGRISLTYNFGNNNIKVRNRNFGSEDEKNRFRN